MPQAVLPLLPLTQEGQSQGGQSMKAPAPSEATPGGSEHEGTERGHAGGERGGIRAMIPQAEKPGSNSVHRHTLTHHCVYFLYIAKRNLTTSQEFGFFLLSLLTIALEHFVLSQN